MKNKKIIDLSISVRYNLHVDSVCEMVHLVYVQHRHELYSPLYNIYV
jgi:hypothetical protein